MWYRYKFTCCCSEIHYGAVAILENCEPHCLLLACTLVADSMLSIHLAGVALRRLIIVPLPLFNYSGYKVVILT